MDEVAMLEGKYLASVKLGPGGQIVVPKEVWEIFGIRPGDTLLLLADMDRGIALQTFEKVDPVSRDVFSDREQRECRVWRYGVSTSSRHSAFMVL